MTIVRTTYRYKRPPRKHAKAVAIEQAVVTIPDKKRAMKASTSDDARTVNPSDDARSSGDKIFGRWEGITQTTVNADGSKMTRVNTVTSLTGGTGKFKGIRGTARGVATTDFKTASGTSEGEYWFEQ